MRTKNSTQNNLSPWLIKDGLIRPKGISHRGSSASLLTHAKMGFNSEKKNK